MQHGKAKMRIETKPEKKTLSQQYVISLAV